MHKDDCIWTEPNRCNCGWLQDIAKNPCEAVREIERLRAELAAYESSPVLATLGPCCGIIRIGDQPEGVVHSGACRFRHAGVLGPTIKLIARKGGGE